MQRKFAISDIHGCFKTFQVLVQDVIKLQKNDTLFLLGDYLDKGPKQFSLIRYIIELQNSGYEIYTIAGNHEMLILNQFYKNERIVAPEIIEYIEKMPIKIEFDKFIFIHYYNYLKFKEIPINAKEFTKYNISEILDNIPNNRIENKIIVYGHMITQLNSIEKAISDKKQFIPIDNGCSEKGKIGFGNLVAFDFDNNKLLIKRNID